MPEEEKVNIGYSVKMETKMKIDELARMTHRTPGHVIDWIIEEAWEKHGQKGEKISVVDAVIEPEF